VYDIGELLLFSRASDHVNMIIHYDIGFQFISRAGKELNRSSDQFSFLFVQGLLCLEQPPGNEVRVTLGAPVRQASAV
jgi:hypothetical protein